MTGTRFITTASVLLLFSIFVLYPSFTNSSESTVPDIPEPPTDNSDTTTLSDTTTTSATSTVADISTETDGISTIGSTSTYLTDFSDSETTTIPTSTTTEIDETSTSQEWHHHHHHHHRHHHGHHGENGKGKGPRQGTLAVGYLTTSNSTIASIIAKDLISDKIASSVNIVNNVSTVLPGSDGTVESVDEVMLVFLTRVGLVPVAKLIIDLDFLVFADLEEVPRVFFTSLSDGSNDYLDHVIANTVSVTDLQDEIDSELANLSPNSTNTDSSVSPATPLTPTDGENNALGASGEKPSVTARSLSAPLFKFPAVHSHRMLLSITSDPSVKIVDLTRTTANTLTVTTVKGVDVQVKVNGNPVSGSRWTIGSGSTDALTRGNEFVKIFEPSHFVHPTSYTLKINAPTQATTATLVIQYGRSSTDVQRTIRITFRFI